MALPLIGDRDLDGLGRVPCHLDPAVKVGQLLLDPKAEVVEVDPAVVQVVGLFAYILADSASLSY